MYSASISTNNLSIGYAQRIVQSNLNFELMPGEMVCMLGPNGCGKSTLLRTLAGLQSALAGSFEITNSPLPIANSAKEASQIALVLTERLSLENTTVHDVVAMGRYPYTSFLGGLSDVDEQIINQSLSDVGLSDTAHTFFNDHSDGEKQRTLIAKALAQQTPIILLDEPTAHLDLPNRIRVLQLLRRVAREQKKTILISTHELDLAIKLSDRIMLMTPEKGIQLDTPDKLREHNAFTAAFGMDIFNPIING
ncbi:MAG: ABC transporter ATP-binding protein [Paludibacteraceae bacterium]|nr:ABC transporter ATP-binding protein [Paludibacteraceae bacterium]